MRTAEQKTYKESGQICCQIDNDNHTLFALGMLLRGWGHRKAKSEYTVGSSTGKARDFARTEASCGPEWQPPTRLENVREGKRTAVLSLEPAGRTAGQSAMGGKAGRTDWRGKTAGQRGQRDT
eukprot:EG_transcript_49443